MKRGQRQSLRQGLCLPFQYTPLLLHVLYNFYQFLLRIAVPFSRIPGDALFLSA
jgi:hypothetical protein